MQLPGFMNRIFATRAPALDRPTPAPPRGESARAVPSMVTALGGGFTPYNPDSLTAWAGADIYKKMLRDPQVKVAYHLLVSIVLGRGWRFEPGGDEESAERQAEIGDFLTFNLEHSLRGTFRQAMKEIMLAKAHGVSVSEKVFEAGDYQGRTMWLLRAIKGKPYQSFRFHLDAQGNLTGLNQEWQGQRLKLDPRKFIIHVFYPEMDAVWGESDLRAAYRAYWSKDVILKLWNIYLERMAGGFLVVSTTASGAVLKGTERTDMESILRNLSGPGVGIILPDGYEMDVNMLNSTDAYEKAVDFQDQQIIRGLFMPALLGFSPQMRVGGFSQAKEQFKAFFNVVTDQGDALADALNEQLFRDLAWWNFGETRPPLFKFDDFTREQKLEIAKQWINAVNAEAVQGTLEDENRLRELIDFDERDPEAEIVTRGGAPAGPGDEEDPHQGNPPQRPGGAGGTPPEKPGRPPVKAAAKFAAGSAPSWRKRVDFKALGAEMDTREDIFADNLGLAVERAWEAALGGVREIVNDGKDALESLGDRTGEMIGPDIRRGLQRAASEGLREGYSLGRATAQEELGLAIDWIPATMAERLRFAAENAPRRAARCKREEEYSWAVADFVEGVRLDTAEKYFAAKAFQISGNISEDIRKAVEAVLLQGITHEKTIAEIVSELELLLKDVIGERDAAGRRVNLGARLNTIARTNLAEAFNQAQLAVYTDPDLGDFVRAFEYSAVLDSRTTDFCRKYDGRVLLKDDPEWSFITPPNHFNCRSRLIPVTAVDEFEPDGALPIEPAAGFGGKKAA